MCILFLFIYHTLMVYNVFENFYIKGDGVPATGAFFTATWPWLMPLLFLIAGISSAYALEKRTAKEYLSDRTRRLLVPLIFGILLLVPMQTYFAEVFHNGYTGNYLEQYVLFFTKFTDLTGYEGGFTPAHLWFILYLFIISAVALPVMYLYRRSAKKIPADKIPLPVLILLFVIPVFTQMILDIGGKSLGEYLTWFLFGYFFISNDGVQEKLRRYRFLLLALTLSCIAAFMLFEEAVESNWILFELFYMFFAWVTMLSIIGLGKQYLNFATRTTAYLSRSSFGIYLFHQQWIVVTAYFAVLWIPGIPLQIIFIILASVVLTFLTYEVFRRSSVTRFMFGLKK